MDKEVHLSSMARLALIAAGGAAAVVTFAGGVNSLEPAAHPAGQAAVHGAASASTGHSDTATPGTGQAAQQYVTRLLAYKVQADPYTQEVPFTLIFDQVPPPDGGPFGQV
jgi:hypothetical protein